jgi:hypothetical protein
MREGDVELWSGFSGDCPAGVIAPEMAKTSEEVAVSREARGFVTDFGFSSSEGASGVPSALLAPLRRSLLSAVPSLVK